MYHTPIATSAVHCFTRCNMQFKIGDVVKSKLNEETTYRVIDIDSEGNPFVKVIRNHLGPIDDGGLYSGFKSTLFYKV